MSSRKDIKKIIRIARSQGWDVVPTRGGHILFIDRDGRKRATAPQSPSCHRAIKNLRSYLRRGGLEI